MQIKFENYEKCYPKRLKKIFQSNLNMRSYGKFIPEMERAVVGNIPPELIKLFPKETRSNDIKAFQNILSDTSKYIRASYNDLRKKENFTLLNPVTYGKSKVILDWEKDITTLFNACLRRLKNQQIFGTLKYLDYGVAGKVFRLSLLDKNGNKLMHDKALKVYHSRDFLGFIDSSLHGNYAEGNFWTYIKHTAGHNLDKTQFTKHYISDLKNAYSLTEFIDITIPKTTAKINYQNLLHLKYLDATNNPPVIGKLYDAGGFKKGNNFIDDKVVLRYFKKLFFAKKNNQPEVKAHIETLVQNPKTPNRDKIQKALDLFNKEQVK